MTGLIVVAALAAEPASQAAALLDVATDYGDPQLPEAFPDKGLVGTLYLRRASWFERSASGSLP